MASRTRITNTLATRLSLPFTRPVVPEQHEADLTELDRFSRELPWDVGWGEVGTVDVNDGSAAAIGTTLTDIMALTCRLEKGRRYYVSATINHYSPGGAGNVTMTLYVTTPTVAITARENAEGRPSPVYGSILQIVEHPYEVVENTGDFTFTVRAQFTAGGGTILYDQQRHRRITVRDVGPAA